MSLRCYYKKLFLFLFIYLFILSKYIHNKSQDAWVIVPLIKQVENHSSRCEVNFSYQHNIWAGKQHRPVAAASLFQ